MRGILLAPLLLAGCGQAGAPGATANGALPADERVDCRIGDAVPFERACTVEAADTADGRVLIVRKADGGFRRLRVTTDGRGVVAADGAEPARVSRLGDGRIEVRIGDDRIRLPATVRAR